MADEKPISEESGAVAAVPAATPLPFSARLTHEIPKPKDWQAFQRNCTFLFQAELGDPLAKEHGRGGQNQRGIDILGRRNGSPDHNVGIQCRRIDTPDTQKKVLEDCRATLGLGVQLKEIIFATTAPNDTKSDDIAHAVEKILREEGYEVRVVIYGWASLQDLIARHEVAYTAFVPSSVSTSATTVQSASSVPTDGLASQIAAELVSKFGISGFNKIQAVDGGGGNKHEEDPALHARIDTYRDLFRQGQPKLAEDGLKAIQAKEDLSQKPWARYRIEANFGSVALVFGEDDKAIAHFEAAYAMRPDDGHAIANLALTRLVQGQYSESMEIARRALAATPPADHAIAYLLQAAARADWKGDVESLVPDRLAGTEAADIGIAEFLRRRELPGWAAKTIELSRRHPDSQDFKRIFAVAILDRHLAANRFRIPDQSPISPTELNDAATEMLKIAEYHLDIGRVDLSDLAAQLNNTALLLRVCGRHAECEQLLKRGLQKVQNPPAALYRLLALSQVAADRLDDAIATLGHAVEDTENQLLAIELIAQKNPDVALEKARNIDDARLNPNLSEMRWRIVGELSVLCGDFVTAKGASSKLREVDKDSVIASLIDIRADEKAGYPDSDIKARLKALSKSEPVNSDTLARFMVSEELHNHGLYDEAVTLLENKVNLSLLEPPTIIYLRCLAASRQDKLFKEALEKSAPAVRSSIEILWIVAIHAWNTGDLPSCLEAVNSILVQDPNHPGARLRKIETLVRQDRSKELFSELEAPVENLKWKSLKDRFRVASLLGHFGFTERAARYSYRLFLENRDTSQAWMTYGVLVLDEGKGEEDRSRWKASVVGPDAAVDLKYDDGEKIFFIVEPDSDLRKLDQQSWEPNHDLIKILDGKKVGDRFAGPDGREGRILALRHKYVARLHYIMKHHEKRFPAIFGFKSVTIDPSRESGLDEFIEELKARHEWVENEAQRYTNGPWPLAVFAHRIGADEIDAASGLASHGYKLKVAVGNQEARDVAIKSVLANKKAGCILDLWTFWTAWRLKALDAVVAVCGPIHLPLSVMDRLRERREKIRDSLKDGHKSIHYVDGKVGLREVPPEDVQEWFDDIEGAITWAAANAKVMPIVATSDLPPNLREYLQTSPVNVFDGIIVAKQEGLLLVTDDRPTREAAAALGLLGAVWLHQLFAIATDAKHITFDDYVRWSAKLIGGGQEYLGLSGEVLTRALQLDVEESGIGPGPYFETTITVIGGANAEIISHIDCCVRCLRHLWATRSLGPYREAASGILLRRLITDRGAQRREILQLLASKLAAANRHDAISYLRAWARGHFILQDLEPQKVVAPAQLPAPELSRAKGKKRRRR